MTTTIRTERDELVGALMLRLSNAVDDARNITVVHGFHLTPEERDLVDLYAVQIVKGAKR